MDVFRAFREPYKPYKSGSNREAAWQIAKAMSGKPVDEVISAWAEMERSRKDGGRPEGWVKFFCGPHKKRDGRAREVLAEIVESSNDVRVVADSATMDSPIDLGEDSKIIWELAMVAFGEQNVTRKLIAHLEHLVEIGRNRDQAS